MKQRRYWASRQDRGSRDLFVEELKAGRLRQGWGYGPKCNLDVLLDKRKRGESFDAEESAVISNYPFHPQWSEDTTLTMQANDIVLVPNTPEVGRFSLVRLLDNTYHFEPMKLETPNNAGLDMDYGHWRSVELLTPDGIQKSSKLVSAHLDRSLKCRSRIWKLNDHAENLEELIQKAQNGNPDILKPATNDDRWDGIARSLQAEARDFVQKSISDQLEQAFHGEGWEFVVQKALGRLFPNATIEWKDKRSEFNHGTDVLVRLENSISGKSEDDWFIPVQVKHYSGALHINGIDQLEKAIKHFGRKRVIALVLITTANNITPETEKRRQEIESKYDVCMHIITKSQLMSLLAEAILPE